MCIVELNVSLHPCRHRWYHLSRSCTPAANLSNCGSKLGLSGWEIKCDFCPYCSGWNVSNTEYRLLGSDCTPSVGGLSRTPSLSVALSATRRESRRGSLARSDSSTSITMIAQEKNRAMNARVDSYFKFPPPPEVPVLTEALPDAENEGESTVTSSSNSDVSSESQDSVRQPSLTSSRGKNKFLSRVRNKSKRLSMTIFK